MKNKNYPRHVAIIMDGNGRWAKKRGLPRVQGHRAGVTALRGIIKYARQIELKYLTLYAFSTENWKRPRMEIQNLMDLLVEFIHREIDELRDNNIKIRVLGDITVLNDTVKREIKSAVAQTSQNDGLILNVAINYGGRDEILRAVKNIVNDVNGGKVTTKDINEDLFESYLYTDGIPHPDLVIRPSGELRISNFLLWQIAYSEFWFSDCFWPDFNAKLFRQALEDYATRERRYGGINDGD